MVRKRSLPWWLAVLVAAAVLRHPAAAGAGDGLVLDPPPGFAAQGAIETFSPETLYDIIDGDAEIYLKAGFLRLDFRRFFPEGREEGWMDCLAYRMADHRAAFSVFSLRRGEEAEPLSVTSHAYRTDSGVFFVHGPFYVEILVDPSVAEGADRARDLAGALVERTPMAPAAIPELGWFPDGGRVAGSEVLHTGAAFGFEGMAGLFSARYEAGEGRGTAFFRESSSETDARTLADRYLADLVGAGGVESPASGLPPGGRLVRILDAYTAVFTVGNHLAGVQDAPTPEAAVALSGRLAASLESAAHP